MAAITEDSVVASLNELRRMADDRARRDHEARERVRIEQQQAGARHTTQGYAQAGPYGRGPTGNHPWADAQGGPGYGYAHAAAAAGAWEATPQMDTVRPRSSALAVVLTTLVLGGAGFFGFQTLQKRHGATLLAKDLAIVQAEDARNRAVESAAKLEQQLKVQTAALEDRLKEMEQKLARAQAAAAAPEEAPAKVAGAKKKVEAKGRALAKASPAKAETPKADAKPARFKIASKKKISDDPLAGIGGANP